VFFSFSVIRGRSAKAAKPPLVEMPRSSSPAPLASAAVEVLTRTPARLLLMRQQEMTARWPGRWPAGLIMAG
jgi:hypothetical protein